MEGVGWVALSSSSSRKFSYTALSLLVFPVAHVSRDQSIPRRRSILSLGATAIINGRFWWWCMARRSLAEARLHGPSKRRRVVGFVFVWGLLLRDEERVLFT